MAKRVLAKVKPEVLSWARESAGFELHEAATAIDIQEARLSEWELGLSAPTIPQLRTLATLYKRPLSVLFLQEVPTGFQVLSDFRRPGRGPMRYSPELTQEIRIAHQRRELAKELLADIGEDALAVRALLDLKMDPEAAGKVVRDFLKISDAALNKFGGDAEGRIALNFWRAAIERVGVLVFQATRVSATEASGFALSYPDLPVVVINRKDPPTRRLFSLLHEFAHVLLQQSGVSDLEIDISKPVVQPAIELFCNAVAAASLMPRDVLLLDPVISSHGRSHEWTDEEIASIAKRFGVSRESLIIRLITLQRTDWPFFQRKRTQYRIEYEEQRQRQAAAPPKPIPRNMPQEALSNFGRPFIGLVIGNYFQDRLTLSEVSGYLGLRTKHVEKLQRLAFGM
ncbi:XRE family transcriptional regulator [Acidovorax sp. NCPPB 3576]|uniref:XRE family transcriptional regulator n=1 Tax=Acidovorax sp. NCPPB 3576 TaxID=2940488 RepID=UPI00234B14D5|nr:XRE family transcriptional regulator [Acidovorax sp. NCPPB 3576]WCM88632.1 XRE family transcriptional regulator [Acidovorax sp. NCPPB 3576]